MVKKIFKTFFYLLVTASIFLLLGLAIEANKARVSNSFTVNVDHSCGNFFVEAEQIKNDVFANFDTLTRQKLSNINLSKIENFITGMIYVKTAEVYTTIDGKIKADVIQRKPLARIINKHGHSFYIDTDGRLMPLSRDFTARVIIVTGKTDLKYTPLVDLTETPGDDINKQDAKLLKDIYKLVKYIDSHPLWGVYIDQIAVTSTGDFELIPKSGSHVIEFGSTKRMEQKFNKLLVFYDHGLTKIGWNKYSRIKLKYRNQVVCVNQ